jgi:hypothetical protein
MVSPTISAARLTRAVSLERPIAPIRGIYHRFRLLPIGRVVSLIVEIEPLANSWLICVFSIYMVTPLV